MIDANIAHTRGPMQASWLETPRGRHAEERPAMELEFIRKWQDSGTGNCPALYVSIQGQPNG